MKPPKNIIFGNTMSFLKKAIAPLGLFLNQATAYLAAFLWKLELPYYLVLIIIFTLIFSMYIKDISKSLAYTLTSVVIGGLIGLIILITPPVLYGSYETIDLILTLYTLTISKLAILNLVISMFCSLAGSFLTKAV